MFYRCLFASPSHYSLGKRLSQAHQGKQDCVNQDFVAMDHNSYHMEFLHGSTWADLFIYVPCGYLLGLPHYDHHGDSWFVCVLPRHMVKPYSTFTKEKEKEGVKVYLGCFWTFKTRVQGTCDNVWWLWHLGFHSGSIHCGICKLGQ